MSRRPMDHIRSDNSGVCQARVVGSVPLDTQQCYPGALAYLRCYDYWLLFPIYAVLSAHPC